MAPDHNPTGKHQTPNVVDLENGDTIELDSSATSSENWTPKNATPERQRSTEDTETHARDGRHKSPLWNTIQNKIPTPITRCVQKVGRWVQGPKPSQRNQIKPLFEPVQTFHTRLFARLPRPVRVCIFVCTFMLWIVVFGVILNGRGLPSDIAGFGAPVKLSCTNVLWYDAPNCGTDGRNCLPFDDSTFAFSCPASCAGTEVVNPRTVGNETVSYTSLIVGGGTPDSTEGGEYVYRGDSFICGAAIHAGVLGDARGGCGVLSLVGQKSSYSAASRNGISSVAFNSSFPMSFDFNHSQQVMSDAQKCRDPRWNLLILSAIFTTVFSLFTTHPATFFGTIFVITYWQVAMASDPPSYTDYPSLASTQLAAFLPAAFIAVVIYQTTVRKTLLHLNAQYEKTILWIGGLWVGALDSNTLDMIPIQRLYGQDLKQQPGAIVALIVIVLVIFAIALYQIWCFRTEGRLARYLGLYAILGIGLGILASVPGLQLRIHHYILGLLLLPGTALQTRLSLLVQGLLVGLFINGVVRWGFASVLQTADALRGDGQIGTDLVDILAPVINDTTITFVWGALAQGYEGVSVLVNDVERFRGNQADGDSNFTWTRQALDHPEYFRFGFVDYLPFGSVSYSDFTEPGIWWPDGRWDNITAGRTSG
ncbi:hypothetical protein P280DRAFT_547070 [Massarina eburnea CBS 473.64]|uniref:LCCL domain-containing protein n=1 Tax=Massarina eburnea CBS 473.64 TaxID=1395130 RepID=A0A6A6S963_9PLEO|nr:hypothetical protein P280DRAFT_547070 [Massarina eburnea CBS 473.64]